MKDFVESLGEKVYHDIMACIGCNDCLLACPLPESQVVTIAELNQAAVQEEIRSANVSEFVLNCTQCQQCVPVCPADLSRADIVLWNKLKVETVAPDRPLPLQVGETIVGSGWTTDSLANRLANLEVFRGVDPLVLRRVLLSVTLRSLAQGETLAREGQYYERLMVIVSGAIEQTAALAEGLRTRILLLDPGSFHGHVGVLGRTQEAFTLAAVEPTVVVEFARVAVERLMRESQAFRSTIEGLYLEQTLWSTCRSSPLLSSMSDLELQALLDEAKLQVLRPGELLYHEGDPASDLYLVRAGFLKVSRRIGEYERVLQYFHESDIAGLTALVFQKAQTATVTANTRSELIVIPGEAVLDQLRRNHGLARQLAAQASEAEKILAYERGTAPPPRSTIKVLSLEGLLDEGIVQGREVLAINTSVCTDCNNCVDACGRRHGYTRLDRSGLQLGEMLFPTACRHCEDPVCLMCSVNGIVRLPDGEIRIVEDNCIGCGACAERCPYDNINMHPRDREPQSFLKEILAFLKGEDPGEGRHSAEKGNRIAAKCDLCAGYEDYACVSACPVGAAMRIDPVKVFGRPDLVVGLEAGKKTNQREELLVEDRP